MPNTHSKMDDAVMRLEIEEGAIDYKTIKVSCEDADGNVCKEELPIFTNHSPKETLVALLEEIIAMQERFEWFSDGNDNAESKKKLIFQHFGRALKGMPQRKWSKIMKNHHTFTLNAFRDKAQRLISEIFGDDAYEEQYQYLCDTKMPRTMKVADYIDRVEVINERLSLLDKEAEKLSERETIRKIITPNIPKEWERDYLLKEGDKAKTLKAAKTILKIIEKADRSKKMEEEPSGKKKPKEQPAPNTTDTNKCRLIGHNHTWKNCPNNPASKNYNGTHYSKIREQERAGTTAPGKTDDKSTNSDNESKRHRKKTKHHDRHKEVSSLNSTDSNSLGSPEVRFSINSSSSSDLDQARDWDNLSQYSAGPNLF